MHKALSHAPQGICNWDPRKVFPVCRDISRHLTIAFFAVAATMVFFGCAAQHVHGTIAADRQVLPQPGGVTITDLSPRFLAFYDSASAKNLDASERWIMWKRLYGFAAVPPTPFGDSLARRLLDSAWTRYPDSLPRIRKGVASIGVNPDVALGRVVALLGCGQNTRVRLIAFVGGFEDNAFAFSTEGVPTIAIPIEAGDAQKSMIHEFTHAVHRSSGCADFRSGYGQSLGELVVSEGLAMRVAEALVPGRPEYSYVAHKQEWLDTARARRDVILNGIRDHVGDAGAAAVQRFTFGGGTTGLSREAYYAGWEIVGELLRNGMSFHDIATTPPGRFPALIGQAIASIEASSSR
jgi:Predicted Zn-dependent protease (DUF2268)